MIEGDRHLEHVTEATLPAVLPPCLLVDLDAGLAGEETERLRKREPIALHDEAEDVAPLAAPEAVPALPGGRDDERGGLLGVEGTEALERGPGLPKRDCLADDVRDAELALDFGCCADRQAAPPGLRRLPPTAGLARSVPDMIGGVSSLDTPSTARVYPRSQGLTRGAVKPCQYPPGVSTRRTPPPPPRARPECRIAAGTGVARSRRFRVIRAGCCLPDRVSGSSRGTPAHRLAAYVLAWSVEPT